MKWLKIKLLYWLTKNLLPIIDDKDIITFAKQGKEVVVLVDNIILTRQEVKNLQTEARVLDEMLLWKLLNSSPTAMAKKKIYNDSRDITDLLFAKTILYTLSLQKNIKDKIQSL